MSRGHHPHVKQKTRQPKSMQRTYGAHPHPPGP